MNGSGLGRASIPPTSRDAFLWEGRGVESRRERRRNRRGKGGGKWPAFCITTWLGLEEFIWASGSNALPSLGCQYHSGGLRPSLVSPTAMLGVCPWTDASVISSPEDVVLGSGDEKNQLPGKQCGAVDGSRHIEVVVLHHRREKECSVHHRTPTGGA